MKSLLICFALLVFAGCSNDDDAPAFTPQNITPVLVGKGLLNPTPLFTRETRVITTPAQWQQLLADMETAEANEGNFLAGLAKGAIEHITAPRAGGSRQPRRGCTRTNGRSRRNDFAAEGQPSGGQGALLKKSAA